MLKLMTFGVVALAAAGLYVAVPKEPAKVASPAAVKQVQQLVGAGVFERVQLGKTPVAYVTQAFHRADHSAKQRFAGYLWQATAEDIVLLYDSRTGKSVGHISNLGLDIR